MMCDITSNPDADHCKQHMAASDRQHDFSTSGNVSGRFACAGGVSNPSAACAETTPPGDPENWKSIGYLAQVLMQRTDR